MKIHTMNHTAVGMNTQHDTITWTSFTNKKEIKEARDKRGRTV